MGLKATMKDKTNRKTYSPKLRDELAVPEE
jgi:hypothetical protein